MRVEWWCALTEGDGAEAHCQAVDVDFPVLHLFRIRDAAVLGRHDGREGRTDAGRSGTQVGCGAQRPMQFQDPPAVC